MVVLHIQASDDYYGLSSIFHSSQFVIIIVLLNARFKITKLCDFSVENQNKMVEIRRNSGNNSAKIQKNVEVCI